MAAALWSLDYLFTLASSSCAGVNLETGINQLDFVSSYSPIGDDLHGHYAARPEFYGMLAFAHAGCGQTLLRSEVDADPSSVKVYATAGSKDLSLTLVLVNKGPAPCQIDADVGVQAKARRVLYLKSESGLTARQNVSFGGAEVAADGTWNMSDSSFTPQHGRRLQISVPAYSAAIAQLR